VKPNWGGTNLERPLQSLFWLRNNRKADDAGNLMTNLVVFTDAQLSNEQLVLATVKQHTSPSLRLFTVALGPAPMRHTAALLARAGGGAVEVVTRTKKSCWEAAIARQLHRCHQPALSAMAVQWATYEDERGRFSAEHEASFAAAAGFRDPSWRAPSVPQAPRTISSLFHGERQIIYGFVPNCTMATLHAFLNEQHLETVVSAPELLMTKGKMLHRLAARSMIRDWEDGLLSLNPADQQLVKKNDKTATIDLSIKYSIVTQFTSFIAVEKRDADDKLHHGTTPPVADLLAQTPVDILDYIQWPATSETEGDGNEQDERLPPLTRREQELVDLINASLALTDEKERIIK